MTNHLVNLIISYLIIFWIFLNVKRSYVNPVSEKMKTLSSSYFFAFLYKDCGKNLIVFWILISAANTLLYASIWTKKKKNSIFEYNYIMYRLWFIGIKSHVEWKKKNKFSVHTHSPRIVSNEILYSKILTLVQWVKIIIQNAYKLYKFLVFGLFLNILLMFCNTPFLGTIYNFSFIFHTRIWLFTEGHFKVWCIFFNVYTRCF